MPVESWLEDPEAWDRLVIGLDVPPGRWTVRGEGVQRRIDVKRKKGSDKARIKDEGYDPAEFQLVGRIHETTEWLQLQKTIELIHPRHETGAGREPLRVSHPVLDFLSISSVYIRRISPPELVNLGEMEIKIDVIEWVASPKKKKPSANVPVGNDGGAPPDIDPPETASNVSQTEPTD